jgi:NADH-quinone oxidoreductase subunit L
MGLNTEQLIVLVPLLPLLGAIFNGLVGHRMPRPFVVWTACGVVLASFVCAAFAFWDIHSGFDAEQAKVVQTSALLYKWLQTGGLDLDIRLVFDNLSGVMTLVVTGVGFLIHVYSSGYMAHEPSLASYFAYLNLFMFAMLVLVLASSLPVMFIGWEGVGLCSYLLIGFWYTDPAKAAAGKKAFIVNRIGDFGFIVAMLVLFRATHTLSFDGLARSVFVNEVSVTVATAACLMLLLGATGKSAQIPLFVWLPDAMAGPTPVSALIHAATMVTAGVYMTCRMGFLFELAPVAMLTMAVIGAATALVAATIAVAQNDIKKVLAYSTVSQLGFMFIAAGVGAYAVALFHVVTHAFFKACLFLGSGSVIHGMSGEQDMRQMGGLWRKQPVTFATFVIAALAITGFPLLAGFISKDAILWNAWASSFGKNAATFAGVGQALWVVGALAAGLTSFYMWRLIFLTFFSGELRAADEVKAHVHESPYSMTVPLVCLAALSLVGGALGWPHLLGGHDWLGSAWLRHWNPALPQGEHVGLEWALMGGATLIALCGFGVAYVLYAKRIHPVTQKLVSERPYRWLYLRLEGKWHLDELYDAVLVRPLVWLSDVVIYEGFDRRVIDALVNFVGWLGKHLGFLGQLFHTGNIQRYLAVFAVALAILLWGWLTPFIPTESPKAAPEPTPPPAAAADAGGLR